MKLTKTIAILLIAGFTSLYAADFKKITNLTDQINASTDNNVKKQLMYDLNKEMESLDANDLVKAQSIIDEKLKQTKK